LRHSSANRSNTSGSVIPFGWRPTRIASMISGASRVNRSTRETQADLTFSAAADFCTVANRPCA